MALDTKQKQGSAIGIGLPFRPWLSDPAESLSDIGSQLSLLHLCSDPIPAGIVFNPNVRFVWVLSPDTRTWVLAPDPRTWTLPEA